MECIIDSVDTRGQEKDPEFFNKEIVVAEKQHVCYECDGVIEPSREYESVTGKWDGELLTFKTCSPCLEIRDKLFCTWFFGEIYEDIREEGIEVDMYFLNIFSPEAQQKIIELVIIESWEDCDFE